MTLNLIAVRLHLNTSRGPAGYECRFGPGLNILNADNSWGKSTLLQSIVYALGLEGSLSATRKAPLGPAMTQAIDTSLGPATIVDSDVTLCVKNAEGRYMRIQRWVVSSEVDTRLVRVWMADSEEALSAAPRQDHFVRDPGAATNALGFHRLLEEFLDWRLPSVPDFNGGETRLYLEVLLPLFYIEQKFGWSGLAPRVPTHYRIRDPLRRAMEFTMGLHTLDELRRRAALKEEIATIRADWQASVARAREAAAAEEFRVVLLDEKPVPASQRRASQMEYLEGEQWAVLSAGIELWTAELRRLGEAGTPAGQRTDEAKAELASAEREVAIAGATVRRAEEHLALWAADQEALLDRLHSVAADRARLLDIRKIRGLGGEYELPLLAEGRCPTCSQDLDGRHVVTGHVVSLEENIKLNDAERETLQNRLAANQARRSQLQEQVDAGQANLQEARLLVRALRDELIGPSGAPSVAEVRRRLVLEARLRGAERALMTVSDVEEELSHLADRLDDTRARLAALDAEPEVASDKATIEMFVRLFREQLQAYGLRSVEPSDVAIDPTSLLPVADGFELSFDLALGISASDSIRTKWAYHTALAETALASSDGRPLGLLVLDEPRQQETNRTSLAHFLSRLDRDQDSIQIIYATSEDPTVLSTLLSGISHGSLPAVPHHLIQLLGPAPLQAHPNQ